MSLDLAIALSASLAPLFPDCFAKAYALAKYPGWVYAHFPIKVAKVPEGRNVSIKDAIVLKKKSSKG